MLKSSYTYTYTAWIKALSYASQEEDEPDFEDNYLLLGLASSAQPNAAEVHLYGLCDDVWYGFCMLG
ncbi:hypothetical protein EON63_23735 [archaeon]|nr:MAG: hypothetical protein EON63_23735 [archaeon]